MLSCDVNVWGGESVRVGEIKCVMGFTGVMGAWGECCCGMGATLGYPDQGSRVKIDRRVCLYVYVFMGMACRLF